MLWKNSLKVALAASLTLGFIGCAPDMPTSEIGSQTLQSQSSGSLRGTIRLPGRLQQSSSQVAAGFKVMEYFLGAPAVAQEEEDDTLDLTEADVENLQATVNDELVDIEIKKISEDEETGETLVEYEVEKAPATEGKEVLEVHTAEGTTIMGAVTDVEEGEAAEQDVDVETTAVLAKAEEIHGSQKIADISAEELEALELDPDVLNMKASLRSILNKDGSLKKNIGKRIFGGDAPASVGKAKAEEAKAKGKSNKPEDAGEAEAEDAAEAGNEAAENAAEADDAADKGKAKAEEARGNAGGDEADDSEAETEESED